MICVVLAAGYATRLYPLTENFPKPLLPINSKPILDWLLDDIRSSGAVTQLVVISNHRFIGHFEAWAAAKPYDILLVDDGTETNDTRLGAVKDIQYAVDMLQLDDDLLVIAGDNVLDFSLTRFIEYAQQKQTSCVMRYFEADAARLRKSGVCEVDSEDKIFSMVEKPALPASQWCCPPFYYYTAADVQMIQEGIAEGCATDAPGSYVSWLSAKRPVHAMPMPGSRYDIGTLESYQAVCHDYHGIVR